jgi:hypothetical protein
MAARLPDRRNKPADSTWAPTFISTWVVTFLASNDACLGAVRQRHAQFPHATPIRHLDFVGRLGAGQDHAVEAQPD